jgi:long-chain acyl-CoA synthetase
MSGLPTPFRLQDRLRDVEAVHPDRVAVVTESGLHTYRELLERSSRFAHCLQAAGVERGDRVVVQLENSWDAACAIYGTLLAGAVLTPVSVQTPPAKVAFVLEDCDARALVAEARLLDDVDLTLPEGMRLVLRRSPAGGGAGALHDALEGAEPSVVDTGQIPNDLAALIYTSGSTGSPKGVMVTHANMTFTAESICRYLELDGDDRLHAFLPFAYGYGLYQLLCSVHVAAAAVVEPSFAFPHRVAERAEAEGVTVVAGVPTVFNGLLRAHEESGLRLSRVRCVTNAAAALPSHLVAPLHGLFPNARVYLMYGLTECQRVCYLDPALARERPMSVGRAIPGTEVLVLGDDGVPVRPGEEGVLHVRGPHVMRGYWRQPELTAETLVDGPVAGEKMLRTHDRFTVDEEGLLYFRGRGSDVVNVGGQKVSPFEVEGVLRAMDGVRDVAVIGVPDAALGETVVAYVVVDGGAASDARALRRFCRGKLETFMIPSRIEFVDALPMTPSGKVAKRELLA